MPARNDRSCFARPIKGWPRLDPPFWKEFGEKQVEWYNETEIEDKNWKLPGTLDGRRSAPSSFFFEWKHPSPGVRVHCLANSLGPLHSPFILLPPSPAGEYEEFGMKKEFDAGDFGGPAAEEEPEVLDLEAPAHGGTPSVLDIQVDQQVEVRLMEALGWPLHRGHAVLGQQLFKHFGEEGLKGA